MKSIYAKEEISNIAIIPDKFIVHRLWDDDAKEERISCTEIRCALISPDITINQPGYYVFLGKHSENGRFVFLKEGKVEQDQGDLFKQVIDGARDLLCHSVYVDKTWVEFQTLWHTQFKYLYQGLKSIGVRLMPTPCRDVLTDGISLFYQYKSALDIPRESILRSQIKDTTSTSLADISQSYAIYCHSHLLSGFDNHKHFNPIEFRERRDEARVERELDKARDRRKNLPASNRAVWEELNEIRERLDSGIEPYEGCPSGKRA